MDASPLNVRPSKRTVTVPRWMKLRPLTRQKWRKTADLITAKDPGRPTRSSGGSIRASNVQALLQLKEAANRPFRSSAPLDPIPLVFKRDGSRPGIIVAPGRAGYRSLMVAVGPARSEERRVGTDCLSRERFGGSPGP